MSQLNTNTTTLQELLDIANALPEAGVVLPELTNPGTASNLLSSKQLIDTEGNIVEGTMINNGAVTKTLNTSTTSYTIPEGYHDGTGKVSITTETKTATPTTSSQSITPTSGKVLSKVTVNGDANLIAENIKSGISIFGVDGSLSSGAQFATGTFTPVPASYLTYYKAGDTIIQISNLTFTPQQIILFANVNIQMPATNTEGGYLTHPALILAGVIEGCIEGGKADFESGCSRIGINYQSYNYGLAIIENGFSWVCDMSFLDPYASLDKILLAKSYSYIAIG